MKILGLRSVAPLLFLVAVAGLVPDSIHAQARPYKPPKETKSVDLKFPGAPSTDPFTANVINLEQRLWEASKNADKATYADLLASDYYEVTDLGISTRAEAVSSVEGPITNYTLGDFKVTKLAENAALVTYRANVRAGGRSQPALNVFDTELWVNKDGKWQTTFFQETAAPHHSAARRKR